MPKYLPTRTRSARPKFDHYPNTIPTRAEVQIKPIAIRPYSITSRSIPDPIRSHSICTRSYTITSRAYPIAIRVDPIATRLCTHAMSFTTSLQKVAKILIRLSLVARYLKTKARLAVAAVLAATASPEPSLKKTKMGKKRSAPTPVEVDDSRDDSPARPLYLLRCTNHNTGNDLRTSHRFTVRSWIICIVCNCILDAQQSK